jgi:phage shock protein A
MDCVEVSVEDRAYEYDLESLRGNVIELEQKIEELEDKLKSLEEEWEDEINNLPVEEEA